MRKTTIFVIAVFIIGLIFISGCADTTEGTSKQGEESYSAEDYSEEGTDVKNIQITTVIARDLDSDGIANGLEFEFKPVDRNNNLVKSTGTFEIHLWETDCPSVIGFEGCGMDKCLMDDEHLLESWTKSVTEADFNPRPKIQFNYANFEASKDDSVTGCAKVVFTTPDGSKFEITKSPIFLNK